MNCRSVIIGLLARDCKESVERNIPRIEKLCSYFADYHVVAVENDSTDGTQQVLQDWAEKNDKVILDSFSDHSQRRMDSGPERISHMVFLRNRILDHIKNLSAPDLVVMMDVDIYDFDVVGIIAGITHAPEDWGGIFANGRSMLPNQKYLNAQYDQFAFMACDEELSDMTYGIYTTRSLNRRGRLLNREVQACDYYPVKSAFGGIGIYRYKTISHLQYRTVMIDDRHHKAYCEHLPLHLDIIQQGYKNYICRSMVVNYGLLRVSPAVAFLLYYCPQVYAVLCDISKYIHRIRG